ncbi:MAG: hypothetical protein CML73_02325 [Rhodobiaceae bacterium]|nr:hypothetical protein [Rhodobiaceae bacterium]
MIRLAAGPIAKAVLNFLKTNAGSTAAERAFRIIPDAGFGLLAATQTPGDLTDKVIAGGTQALGGILGGIGTVGGLRMIKGLKDSHNVLNLADMAGSVAGDFAGMAVGDSLMKTKDTLMGGSGLTPYERLGEREREAYAQALKQQMLAQYGFIPGTREQYTVINDGSGVV